MFIYEVCESLDRAGIPYALVGGYAVALHGAMRGTLDIDFVIDWTLENLKKAQASLTDDLGLVSRIPINAEKLFQCRDDFVQNKHLIAWNFYDPKNPAKQVDLIVTFDLAKASTETILTPRGKLSVLSKKDLILMKQASGRPQDLADVEALKKL